MNIAQHLGLVLPLTIDPEVTKATSGQSKQALMFAHEYEPPGVLMNRGPVDMRLPRAKNTLIKAVEGRAAIPRDNGQYYLVMVGTSVYKGDNALPVILPEGEVVEFVHHHHTLAAAQRHNLLTYVRPVDLRDPNVRRLIEAEFGDGAHLPPEGPHQFLVHVNGQPVLLAGGDVLTFACDQWALRQGELSGAWACRFTVDLRQPGDRAVLADTIGLPDFEAISVALNGELTEGVYHLVSLQLPDGRERPALIRLGDAWASARMAIAYGATPEQGTDPEGLLPL